MNHPTWRNRTLACISIACLRRVPRLLPILLGFHLGVAVEPTTPARPEPWVKLPFAQWPQLVLTNDATFKGHTPLHGASAFLVRGPNGATLAATARHLLGPNGGVEPTVGPDQLDKNLKAWTLFPRTRPKQTIRILGSAMTQNPPERNDWLLLRVEGAPKHAHPLTLRRDPVKAGEKVFLVGVSYAEPTVAQKVYAGVVTDREIGDRFRYDITPHVDIRGFSGAPILDQSGFVVGVMSVCFEPRTVGELHAEAGGVERAQA